MKNKKIKNSIMSLLIISNLSLISFTGCGSNSTEEQNNSTKTQNIKNETKEPEIINGYVLPPEPDPKINNSTLLGVDVNNNGIRDDVERYIIKEFPQNYIDLNLIFAKTDQMILKENLTKKEAKEIAKIEDIQLACFLYLKSKYYVNYKDGMNNRKKSKNKVYNTKERVLLKLEYEQLLSGGVYSIPIKYSTKKTCQDLGIDFTKMTKSVKDEN